MMRRLFEWENGPLYLGAAGGGGGIVGVVGMFAAPGVTGWPVVIGGTIGALVGITAVWRGWLQ